MMRIYLSFRHENDDQADGPPVSAGGDGRVTLSRQTMPLAGGRRPGRNGLHPWWERSGCGRRLIAASR